MHLHGRNGPRCWFQEGDRASFTISELPSTQITPGWTTAPRQVFSGNGAPLLPSRLAAHLRRMIFHDVLQRGATVNSRSLEGRICWVHGRFKNLKPGALLGRAWSADSTHPSSCCTCGAYARASGDTSSHKE